ncbi:O-antigen ligase family protein [Brumimicrobium aurantiacum]|uniref:O-antigen ligase family protein n=1 Tax=Brumimicrobium aurantiacum TaxID=1737063 RepID=A0A3E1EYM8_9FLAO|nr:O-antigen ligase family protein [Brumimicrobium aurantiacum]RFC54648.1 O-antigen ligase family protein [Brumimicrobium aurantiacum]
MFNDNYFFNALPLVLIIAYLGFFHTSTAFLLVAFCTPLSVNLEEFTDGKIGLFLPTEPILFGLMLLVIMKELKKPSIGKAFWMHPITLSIGFYLMWVFMTSITSSNPLVSFKFLLMKLWYIIPILMIGFKIFEEKKNIVRFLWCYTIAMAIVISYTLIRHWGYSFGEKEGHWVMSPFFKDHTIYGASIAISLIFNIGLYFYKKHSIQAQVLLIILFIITLLGLYFSYTRGAWLSVVFALAVWAFIKYKIKFKYLLGVGISLLLIVLVSWTQIEIALAKNKHEHTTTNFDERLQSAANISSDASNLERLNRWGAAWNMFLERPVFGFGPATYAFEYAPYQDPENLTIISTNFGNQGNAHSEYLGPLAEMGLIGTLSVLAFVAALFYCGIMLLIHLKRYTPEDKEMYIIILCLILAMSTYFFHGLLNNYLDTDKASIPVYGVSAIIIAQSLRLKQKLKTN